MEGLGATLILLVILVPAFDLPACASDGLSTSKPAGHFEILLYVHMPYRSCSKKILFLGPDYSTAALKKRTPPQKKRILI